LSLYTLIRASEVIRCLLSVIDFSIIISIRFSVKCNFGLNFLL